MGDSLGDEVCLIDAALGFADPKNVYNCKKPLKCCVQYQAPSCCGSHNIWVIVQQQLMLWGGLFAILVAIAVLFYCRNNDIQIPALVRFRDVLTRFCCGVQATGDVIKSSNTGSAPFSDPEYGQPLTMFEVPKNDLRLASSTSKRPPRSSTAQRSDHFGWRNNSVSPLDQHTSAV